MLSWTAVVASFVEDAALIQDHEPEGDLNLVMKNWDGLGASPRLWVVALARVWPALRRG